MAELFSVRRGRSFGVAAVAAFVGHMIVYMLPQSLQIFTFTQTSIAILAICSLMVLVVAHHRRHGEVLSQTQEEMILIGAFGLFWFAILIALRAFRAEDGAGTAMARAPSRATGGRQRAPFTGRRRSWCHPDDMYCVVEEYSYY
ncbi:hypothetical protein JAAARDRAFT_28151 [Jaapia argillacea MUCL 33604]|uniref:Uncharacterized protein n=1 Tax=Jaapia argillacea MUCL 33604 TaxID=933084 RepID=A0A067QBS4_9AGAM|nr:hypothetical protein JAAARDRAFT_28151 [Jaapia argillacea MUCL 33604]